MSVLRTLMVVAAVSIAASLPAFAHVGGHDTDETQSPRVIALTSATYVVERMIERHAIPESWRGIEPSSAVLRQHNGGTEWLVTFQNAAITNPVQRTLYVMLTPSAVYIAANYTGE